MSVKGVVSRVVTRVLQPDDVQHNQSCVMCGVISLRSSSAVSPAPKKANGDVLINFDDLYGLSRPGSCRFNISLLLGSVGSRGTHLSVTGRPSCRTDSS
jgi:hypothetical protein